MAQWLTAFAALQENLNWVSSTQLGRLTTLCNPSITGIQLFWPRQEFTF